jgi:hypothetical protein
LGEQLREAIRTSGSLPYALSKKAGVSPSMIARFLSGERDIKLDTAGRLFSALGLAIKAPTDTEPKGPPPRLLVFRQYRPLEPLVRGERLRVPLSPREADILKAMVRAGCLHGRRVTGRQLDRLSGRPWSVRTLREMRKDPQLGTILDFPRSNGRPGAGALRGYGLATK